jgi:hypothetical protein
MLTSVSVLKCIFYLICLYWGKGEHLCGNEFEKVRLEKSCHVSHDRAFSTDFSSCFLV